MNEIIKNAIPFTITTTVTTINVKITALIIITTNRKANFMLLKIYEEIDAAGSTLIIKNNKCICTVLHNNQQANQSASQWIE